MADEPLGSTPFVPEGAPDLEEAFRKGTERLWKASQRPDNDLAHVSDMTGICDRLTWARRAGITLAEPAYESQTAMSMGLHLEPYMLDRLENGLADQGWTMERQVRIALSLKGEEIVGRRIDKDTSVGNGEIVGHLDALLLRENLAMVLDTKTEVWRSGMANGVQMWKHDADWRHNYKLQISSYAFGIGNRYSALFGFNKANCGIRSGWFDREDYRAEIVSRFMEVLARTSPDKPEPTIGPNPWTIRPDGESWACGRAVTDKAGNISIRRAYCEYHQCDRHIETKLKALGES